MHLIEAYANHVGVKLPKEPVLPEQAFCPTPEKYIVLYPFAETIEKTYLHFEEVIEQIQPVLNELNIKIVQIGNSKEPLLKNCNPHKDQTIMQNCYIVKNALMYLGCDSVWSVIAGIYKTPLISIFGYTKPEINGPYYHDPEKTLFFRQKNINDTKPEEVVNAILKLLGVENKTTIVSEYIGPNYNNSILEFIPRDKLSIPVDQNSVLTVRLDREFNIENTIEVLKSFKCLLLTNKPLPIEIFNTKNIHSVIYDISNLSELDSKFVSFLYNRSIPYQVITSMPENDLQKLKLILFDLNHPLKKEVKEPLSLKGEYFFKSKRLTLCGSKLYLSYWHLLNGIEYDPSKERENKLPDTFDLTFWENKDNIYIYKHETL